MENRSNNVLVGAVVLILLLLAVVVTVWLASFGGAHEKRAPAKVAGALFTGCVASISASRCTPRGSQGSSASSRRL